MTRGRSCRDFDSRCVTISSCCVLSWDERLCCGEVASTSRCRLQRLVDKASDFQDFVRGMYRAQVDAFATASNEHTNTTLLDEAFSETNRRDTVLITAHLCIQAPRYCNKGSLRDVSYNASCRWLSRSSKCSWAGEHETFST